MKWMGWCLGTVVCLLPLEFGLIYQANVKYFNKIWFKIRWIFIIKGIYTKRSNDSVSYRYHNIIAKIHQMMHNDSGNGMTPETSRRIISE